MVISFPGYVPPPRYDDLPWVAARLEESATQGGLYTTTDTFTLDPLDTDPANPRSRDFTTDAGTADYWYRLVWVDEALAESVPTLPGQNTAGTIAPVVSPFATSQELASICQVNHTSNEAALNRVLEAAAGEIVRETGRSDFTGWEADLVAQVNLARAQELWQQMKAPFGVSLLGAAEFGPTHIARDTFGRHAIALAPLKTGWGIA